MTDSDRTEDQLRQKIASKMSVSTFLAGFNFTALNLVLGLSKPYSAGESSVLGIPPGTWADLGAVLFFSSTVLFVATVYSYDRLLMPPEYWRRTELRSRRKTAFVRWYLGKLGEPQDSLIYGYMLLAWSAVFIPGTFLALLGTIAMFAAFLSPGVLLVVVGVAVALAIYYVVLRPELGLD